MILQDKIYYNIFKMCIIFKCKSCYKYFKYDWL